MILDEFMAPELMLGNDYNEKSDIFSFGMLMFEIIARKDVGKLIPRSVKSSFGVDEKLVRPKLPPGISLLSYFHLYPSFSLFHPTKYARYLT